MSWAERRRFFILLILGAVIAAFFAVVLIATFHAAPSCIDNIQNQDETGVDCGGSCPYLCTALEQPPTVIFTKALDNGAGRTDVVALVENKNVAAAAKNVPYRITLYGNDQTLIGNVTGVIDLPPGATVPVYAAGVATGGQVAANAFLDIASSSPRWFMMKTDPRTVPTVANTTLGGTASAPRIQAVLTNPSEITMTNVQAAVLVHSTNGNVIAASKTVVPVIPAQGSATAIFTWNNAFPGPVASLEVIPIVPLSSF